MLKSLFKTLSVLVAAAGIIGAATVLSGASEKSSVTVTLKVGKGDRLDIRATGPDCSGQAWPYYEASCLKDRRQTAPPSAANPSRATRIVTTDRLPAATVTR